MDITRLYGKVTVNGEPSAATIVATPRVAAKRPAGALVPVKKVIVVPSTGIVPGSASLDAPGGVGTWPKSVTYDISITAAGVTVTSNYEVNRSRRLIDLGTINITATTSQTTGLDMRRIFYTNGSYGGRPQGLAAGRAIYVGPVQPTSWQNGDVWIEVPE